MTDDQAGDHVNAAFDTWTAPSDVAWTLDLGVLTRAGITLTPLPGVSQDRPNDTGGRAATAAAVTRHPPGRGGSLMTPELTSAPSARRGCDRVAVGRGYRDDVPAACVPASDPEGSFGQLRTGARNCAIARPYRRRRVRHWRCAAVDRRPATALYGARSERHPPSPAAPRRRRTDRNSTRARRVRPPDETPSPTRGRPRRAPGRPRGSGPRNRGAGEGRLARRGLRG